VTSPVNAPDAPVARVLRADARRNRERVLAAARECFAEKGADVQMDDIAKRADLGVGTLYRHFPDKAALLEALKAEHLEQIAAMGREALEQEDPWESFATWLSRCAELQASNRGFSEAISAFPLPKEVARAVAERVGLVEINTRMIARGQAAGVIRPDLRAEDIPLVMCAAGATILADGGPLGGSWRRCLALVIDGLRAPATSPLPE
jgi:AcrR family transcriptional regulator